MTYQKKHILVCISPFSSSNLIHTAATIAHKNHAQFTALYVETPATSKINRNEQEKLQKNINDAKNAGANIETAFGNDIAFQITEFVKNANVSEIFIGCNYNNKHFFYPTIHEQILKLLPNINLNVVYHQEQKNFNFHCPKIILKTKDFILSITILLIATLIGILFHQLGFSEANTITVYILSVLVTAIATSNRIYSIVSSILSVLIFNFLFTTPRFTLTAYGSGYPITFIIMLAAAFITSTLAIRMKQQAKQSAIVAYRTKVLLETNRLLQKEKTIIGIKDTTAHQIIKLLNKDVIIYKLNEEQLDYHIYGNRTINLSNDYQKIKWIYIHNKPILDKDYYLPIASNNNIYGVIKIILENDLLDTFENNLILSIIGESALALEKELFNQKKEEAAIAMKNERLRANLLRSISHDLRTPLTSISGNAAVLMNNAVTIDEDKKNELYENIYDDSIWLINLVENLLSVTRLEDGTMHLNLETELIDEVINEALNHISRDKCNHNIKVIATDELILSKIDAHLIMQVIINIVDNAIKYTQTNSTIIIETIKQDKFVEIKIKDNGPGISNKNKEKLFDMFYTVKQVTADGRRGLGLGLALCKAIIIAHGGNINVSDNSPCGTIFSFTLPIKEVEIHA